jgi:HupE / UreJ protein
VADVLAFVPMGFHHITDVGALDHLLFLLALAAIYRGKDWRAAAWVVTAFTAGHSLTLALAATDALRLPTSTIEFLIPVTILATGVENLLVREDGARRRRYRAALAGVFGLIHGAGFANLLRELFSGAVAAPLLGFNIGIELGQLLVLAAAAVTLTGVDQVLGHRRRVVAVSAIVVVAATTMALERTPW